MLYFFFGWFQATLLGAPLLCIIYLCTKNDFLGSSDNPGEATEPKSVQGTPSTHNISIGTPGIKCLILNAFLLFALYCLFLDCLLSFAFIDDVILVILCSLKKSLTNKVKWFQI